MSHVLAVPVRVIASAGALGLTPYLLTRALQPRLSLAPSIAAAGLLTVCLNTVICVAFHVARIPLTPTALLAHMPHCSAWPHSSAIAVVHASLSPHPSRRSDSSVWFCFWPCWCCPSRT